MPGAFCVWVWAVLEGPLWPSAWGTARQLWGVEKE